MSQLFLQNWLLQVGIRADLDLLTKITVRDSLDGLAEEDSTALLAQVDWPRLLLAGSVLARSEDRIHQEAALRIATAAICLPSEPRLKDAAAVLLGKLSNFRAIALAEERGLLKSNLQSRLGVALRLEEQHRELSRSVLVESSGTWLQVNEFQHRFWIQAGESDWLSASAPTASGKTFLVLKWLLEHLISCDTRVAVYLAPTRALVTEIESSLQTLLSGIDSIEVSSLPLPEKFRIARNGGPKLILVLTQERLHLLANLLGDDLRVDLAIVDEAHKIGDNQRGVILQDAIERVSRTNSNLKVVFISPATRNPEELLADAPEGKKAVTVDSDASTVLQNIVIASQAPGRPKLWLLKLKNQTSLTPIGVLELRSTPGSVKKKLAFIAAGIGVRGGTLVYANGASEAEEIAALIVQLIEPIKSDPELAQLAELARKGVHREFRLAPLVESGVAFHYGNMPSLIRIEIERLFRSGKIKFLVCTSTLIEGVNLSCRTIVVRGPRKGKGHPMEPHDFWNLAGRAGRWGDEFQGNIVCIDAEDCRVWPTGVPNRSRYPILRESDAVLADWRGLVQYLQDRATEELPDIETRDRFEQVGAYLLTTHLRHGSISKTGLAKRHGAEVVEGLDAALAKLGSNIEIDADMAGRHPGVSAVGMQRLLNAFRAYRGDIENLLPAHVASNDSYDRFITIMDRINKHLFPAFVPNARIPLFAFIIVAWLKGYSLPRIIRDRIKWAGEKNVPYKLPELIRGTMELVEQVARFKAPKYFSAYVDVLKLRLKELGRSDLINDGLDIGTQLEFGVSSITLLSLMELGLSRMSAVALYEEIARDDLDKEGCAKWVQQRVVELRSSDLPKLILREIGNCFGFEPI